MMIFFFRQIQAIWISILQKFPLLFQDTRNLVPLVKKIACFDLLLRAVYVRDQKYF